MLPPTRASLLPHITRANYIALRDKSYTYSNPELPSIEQNGWQLDNNIYAPVRCVNPPAPQAVLEIKKCVVLKLFPECSPLHPSVQMF